MDVESLKAGMIECLATTSEVLTNFAFWTGHKVQVLSQNYLVPAMEYIWSAALASSRYVESLVNRGSNIPFTSAGVFLLIGIVAFKIADHKAYEDEILAKNACKAIGIVAFAVATLAMSVGIAAFVI